MQQRSTIIRSVIMRVLGCCWALLLVSLAETCDQTPDGPFLLAAENAYSLPLESVVMQNPVVCPPEAYWIISIRSCPQFFWRSDNDCCLDFLYRTPDGCLHQSDRATFLASICPHVPTCFMIHGSYVSWSDAKIDAILTYRWLRTAQPCLPLNYVYLTWPSDAKIPPLDIIHLGRRSARNAFRLARLLREFPPGHPISFIGHSHGCRMAFAALHLMAGGKVQGHTLGCGCCAFHRYRVVCAAAAIDHDWLNPGRRYGATLPHIECVLNFRNCKDHALLFYPLRKPFARRSLGRKGWTRHDLRELGTLICRTSQLDVASLLGTRHFWLYYRQHVCLAQAAAPYVFYPDLVMKPAVPPQPELTQTASPLSTERMFPADRLQQPLAVPGPSF